MRELPRSALRSVSGGASDTRSTQGALATAAGYLSGQYFLGPGWHPNNDVSIQSGVVAVAGCGLLAHQLFSPNTNAALEISARFYCGALAGIGEKIVTELSYVTSVSDDEGAARYR